MANHFCGYTLLYMVNNNNIDLENTKINPLKKLLEIK